MTKYRIAWMPGDGIGNDVMDAAKIVLDRIALDAEYVSFESLFEKERSRWADGVREWLAEWPEIAQAVEPCLEIEEIARTWFYRDDGPFRPAWRCLYRPRTTK